MGALSLGHILMVLLVVILVFGTKKLSSLGGDLGEAIKGFRKAMASDDTAPAPATTAESAPPPAPDLAKTSDERPARHP